MRALPIRARLTAWYLLILAVSLLAFGCVTYFAMRSSIRAAVDEDLELRLGGVRSIIVEDGPKGSDELEDEFHEYSDGQGKGGRLRVAATGHVIYDSADSGFLTSARWNGQRIVMAGNPGNRFRVLHDTLMVDGVSYDVMVATSMHDYGRALDGVQAALGVAAPFFLVIAAFGGYWLSARALVPVDQITEAARKIGAQDLGQRLKVPKAGDELERLADTLNGMLGRLEAAFQRITKFTADASHELRTPVSVMRTSAEIALRKPRSEAEYRETLGQILHESERLSQLIEQLLILARSDAGSSVLPMIRIDLTKPLRSACQQASILAEKKQLAFSEKMPAKPLWVHGDSPSLERMFLVLLDNAVKYTPDGGSIAVDLNAENGFAVTAIRDTGIGVAQEDIPHVFERFYRADPARTRDLGGSGLGLAIGNWIAQVHGGEIRIESEISRGSCFQVRLPLAV